MMALALGQCADAVGERKRLAKIPEAVRTLDGACLVRQRPAGDFGQIPSRLLGAERCDSALARRADLPCKFRRYLQTLVTTTGGALGAIL